MTITDLYRNLFGRSGTTRGTDIDMAEHGRTGGVSTGEGYKKVKNPEEQVIIDAADSSTTYTGAARIAGSSADAIWQVKRIVVNGTITSFAYADGDDNYDNVWDDRAGLVYS